MSQPGSQSSQNVRLCMPLAKFSYANVPSNSMGPIPWVHLNSHGDLFVLVEPMELNRSLSSTTKNKRRFKILQDPNVHEDLDLLALAIEARHAIEQAQSAGVQGRQPSITVIVKNPCVAMRYPGHGGQIRRFQVRFAQEEDFYETLKLFASTKLPFIEAGGSNSHSALPAPPNLHHNLRGNTTNHAPSQNTTFNLNLPIPHQHNREQATTADFRRGEGYIVQAHGLTTTTSDRTALQNQIGYNGNYHGTFMSQNQPSPFTSSFVPRPPLDLYPERLIPSSDMPPKRDLPFAPRRKAPPSTAPAKIDGDGNSHLDPGSENSRAVIPAPEPGTAEPKGAKATGKKRPAAKPRKAPAQKKNKTTTSDRNVATNAKPTADSPVKRPTEVIRRAEQVDQDTNIEMQTQSQTNVTIVTETSHTTMGPPKATRQQTRLKKQNTTQKQDTQIQHIQIGMDPENIIPSIEQHSAGRPVTRSITAEPALRDLTVAPAAPVTSRIRKTAKQPSQIKKKKKPAAKNTKAQSIHIVTNNDSPSSTNPPALPSRNTTSPPPNTQIQPRPSSQKPTQSTPLQLLLSDPNFAEQPLLPTTSTSTTDSAVRGTTTFSDLTESERHQALESWMAEMFRDPEFLTLCKTLDGVWERLLVKY